MRRCTIVIAAVAASLALPAAAAACADPPGRTQTMGAPFVGLTAETLVHGDGEYRRCELNKQAANGVGTLRQVFSWARVEHSPGSYDWSFYDALVADAAQHGISVLPILFDPPSFRSKRRGSANPSTAYPPKSNAAFANFARAAVRRYGPNGSLWSGRQELPKLPIRVWQVWNEPNLKAYWGLKPNARQYTALLKAANGAIKGLDRPAEVVTAGMPDSRSGIKLDTFVTSMYKAGAKTSFDTLAVHPYARRYTDVNARVRRVRALMNRNRDKTAGIRVTEFGWADSGPKSTYTVGARAQALATERSMRAFGKDRKKLRLKGITLYNWRDGDPAWRSGSKDAWGFYTGLLRADGSEKPALAAFKRAALALR